MDLTTKAAGMARAFAIGAAGLGLAGCSEFPSLNLVNDSAKAAQGQTQTETTLIERDVEAPEVFSVTESGLWDGRPSLGGVWVAHPDVGEPERVIIRNTSNGKFVIGALFRRERDIPGPRLQASSDAAAALGMLAGAPVELNVTALRREEATPDPLTEEVVEAEELAAVAAVEATELDAVAALEAGEETPSAAAPETVIAVAAPATATPAAVASNLDKPYIQIGIFSVEANANRAADTMRGDGLVPTVYKEEANGKTFWRVVVGPAATRSERSALMKQIKNTGFTDAYAVND
nr:SPOR domain-containing protein [Marinibacterium profundimaris]